MLALGPMGATADDFSKTSLQNQGYYLVMPKLEPIPPSNCSDTS